jgi:hypothetical protein
MQFLPIPSRRLAWCAAAGLFLLGMGIAVFLPSRRQPRVSVSGKITVDGQPLEMGVIHFVPNKSKGNKSSHFSYGMVKGGTYEVEGGIPPGWYRVVVGGNIASGQGRRLRGFTNQDKPVSVEIVKSGGTEPYNFTLASSPSRPASKRRY